MSRLEELIAEHCPNGVEYVTLGESGTTFTGLTGKNKNHFDTGDGKFIPYTNIYANRSVDFNDYKMVDVSHGEKQNVLQYGDIILTGSSEGLMDCGMTSVVNEDVSDEKYYLNSFCFGYRFNDNIEYNIDFIKHLFDSYTVRRLIVQCCNGVTRYNLSKKKFMKLSIPLPPIEVQNEIVRILDTFTELTQELTQERELREKQYDYYRDTLLTFDDDVEVKKLGDVCEIMNGYAFQSKHYDTEGVRIIRISDVQDGYLSSHDEKYYNREVFEDAQLERYLLEHSDIVMSMTGNVGRVAYIKESDSGKIALNQRVAGIKHKLDDVNMRYIYYYLSRDSFMELAQNNSTGGGQKNLGINRIRDFQIPIPPIEVQNEIVEKLDRFNTLANDINHGLPKEIELRTKQYEYYRDKLLTFKEVTA